MPVTIDVLLKPGAKNNAIELAPGGGLRIRVTARPVDGKANAGLIRLLAKALRVPKSSLSIVKGTTSRAKVIAVDGLDSTESLYRRLREQRDTA